MGSRGITHSLLIMEDGHKAPTRPRTRQSTRSVKKIDYSILGDVKVPKCLKSSKPSGHVASSHAVQEEKLYHLEVLESDAANELVKVRYIGYDSTYDEWRPATDIIDMTEDDPSDSSNFTIANGRSTSLNVQPSIKNFSLYEELCFRIKALLVSTRKGDPNCCMSMPFDKVHFNGLIRRGVLDTSKQHSKNLVMSSACSRLT